MELSDLSPETQNLWRAFMGSVNKQILHPLDRERLHKFIAAAFIEGKPLDGSDVHEWLLEAGEQDDFASKIAVICDTSVDAIKAYNKLCGQ